MALSLFVVAAALALAPAAAAASTQITITDSVGVPDRGDTANAIDGNLATDTYTTPSNTTDFPAYLEFGFASAKVNRIRLYKDNYVAPHELVIQYTTDTGPLTGRSWTNVSNLANGFDGSEFLNASSVNSDGTVNGDVHNSPGGDGWASLTFKDVTATGIRIVFSSSDTFNHYHVFEFEAWLMPHLFSIQASGGSLWAVDPNFNFIDVTHDVTVSGHTICTGNGLATQPTTGTLFGVLWLDGCAPDTRTLVTIDPVTGVATIAGNLGGTTQKVAAIAFGADQNTLYAVTGNSGSQPQSLFTVDPGDGTLTRKCVLATGRGHALAFAEGFLFHATADTGDLHLILERIDPSSFPVDPTDPCPVTGIANTNFFEPSGMVTEYSGGGTVNLLLANFNYLYEVTIPGVSDPSDTTFLGFMENGSKGLAFNDATVVRGNLTVSKSASKFRLKGKRYIQYTLGANNAGPDDVEGVVVTDPVPAGTVFFSSGGICGESGGVVTCNVGGLGAGSTVGGSFTVAVTCKKCSSIFNQATIGTTEDIYEYPFDNSASTNTPLKGKF